jgi:hypothetical protein
MMQTAFVLIGDADQSDRSPTWLHFAELGRVIYAAVCAPFFSFALPGAKVRARA